MNTEQVADRFLKHLHDLNGASQADLKGTCERFFSLALSPQELESITEYLVEKTGMCERVFINEHQTVLKLSSLGHQVMDRYGSYESYQLKLFENQRFEKFWDGLQKANTVSDFWKNYRLLIGVIVLILGLLVWNLLFPETPLPDMPFRQWLRKQIFLE